ncbi:MAG: 1-acylglycerol-3-phosphate O-acyltransferase [Desulfobacterales bacterium]|jgi:1-acyl-sn-glycerol-3-phosphate acyltransferase|nr:1-acylglycerol-3-phosphate O-acyltransferase [Desulfobacterales bacterium]
MRLVDVVAVEGVVFVTLFFSIISFIVSFFQNTGDIAHCVARLWARIVLIITGVKVRMHGLEHIDEKETYVFMSNHQSMYDIPALLGHLRVQFRWLAKIELFRIPVFGRAMSNAGYIEIDRANRKAAFRSIQRAARKVQEGTSVLVFPEGSRSDDGRIKPFKKGGFVLALSSGRPIVPVTILGSGAILPKGSLRIEPGRILLRIHPPVETTGFSNKNIDALMETVRSIMCRDLKMEKDANG